LLAGAKAQHDCLHTVMYRESHRGSIYDARRHNFSIYPLLSSVAHHDVSLTVFLRNALLSQHRDASVEIRQQFRNPDQRLAIDSVAYHQF
jgi:hypothetical protein